MINNLFQILWIDEYDFKYRLIKNIRIIISNIALIIHVALLIRAIFYLIKYVSNNEKTAQSKYSTIHSIILQIESLLLFISLIILRTQQIVNTCGIVSINDLYIMSLYHLPTFIMIFSILALIHLLITNTIKNMIYKNQTIKELFKEKRVIIITLLIIIFFSASIMLLIGRPMYQEVVNWAIC